MRFCSRCILISALACGHLLLRGRAREIWSKSAPFSIKTAFSSSYWNKLSNSYIWREESTATAYQDGDSPIVLRPDLMAVGELVAACNGIVGLFLIFVLM